MCAIYLLIRFWLIQVLSPKQREVIETLFYFIRKLSTKGPEMGKSHVQCGGCKRNGSITSRRIVWQFYWNSDEENVMWKSAAVVCGWMDVLERCLGVGFGDWWDGMDLKVMRRNGEGSFYLVIPGNCQKVSWDQQSFEPNNCRTGFPAPLLLVGR